MCHMFVAQAQCKRFTPALSVEKVCVCCAHEHEHSPCAGGRACATHCRTEVARHFAEEVIRACRLLQLLPARCRLLLSVAHAGLVDVDCWRVCRPGGWCGSWGCGRGDARRVEYEVVVPVVCVCKNAQRKSNSHISVANPQPHAVQALLDSQPLRVSEDSKKLDCNPRGLLGVDRTRDRAHSDIKTQFSQLDCSAQAL